MEPVIDAEARDGNFVVIIKTLLPGNQRVTDHAIPVKAGNQVEAIARAIEEWKDKTSPDLFQAVDIKKVK